VTSWDSNSIDFWAGGINIRFYARKAEWQSKEKVSELATKLIDLGTVAAWPKIEDAQ
jgi:hypothetical protein